MPRERTELDPLLHARMRALVIIWWAFCGSIVIYGVVGYFVVRQPAAGEVAPAETRAILRLVLAGLSVGLGAGAIWLRQRTYSEETLRARLEGEVDLKSLAMRGGGDDGPAVLDEDLLRQIEALPPGQQRLLALIGFLTTRTIIILALTEAIAICGLVLTFVSRDLSVMIPFAAVALVVNQWAYPSLSAVVGRARAWLG